MWLQIMNQEKVRGSGRGYSCSSKVTNSALVQHFSGNAVPGTIRGYPTQRKSTSTTKTRKTVLKILIGKVSGKYF